MSSLLEPINIGGEVFLRNRIVMGSMTRNRCIDDGKPGPAQVKHYADRARDGTALIVNEGTFVDWVGVDWKWSPLMVNQDHAQAWKKVTDAVHAEGGKILFQAWHPGRCQHDQMPGLKEHDLPVLAPSSVKANAGKYRDLPGAPGHTDNIQEIENPAEVVEIYKRSFQLAKEAGFDGVELLFQGHIRLPRGYLPHQFLMTRANKRTDAYGGSVENRCRFLIEIFDAASQVFDGPERLCVRLNPTDYLNDSVVDFDEMKETYTYLIKEMVSRRAGIINLSRRGANPAAGTGDFFGRSGRPEGYPLPHGYDPVLDFGPLVKFPGSPSKLMANHDYTVQEADDLIRQGKLDLISFARPFIYNPDVVTRIRHGIPLATNDRGPSVHYGPYKTPDENYNDWPAAM